MAPSNIHLEPKLEESGRCFYLFSFWKMFSYVFFSRMIPKICKRADLKQCRMIGICLWYPRFVFTHNTQIGLEANKTPTDGWHMDSWWNKLPCIFHSSWFHLAVFKAHMNILVQQGFTLPGTNISPTKGTFEDDVPFPKVGYVQWLLTSSQDWNLCLILFQGHFRRPHLFDLHHRWCQVKGSSLVGMIYNSIPPFLYSYWYVYIWIY